jgi:hypothetical protein
MMPLYFTQNPALEKILGLHYRGFEILALVFTRSYEPRPFKISHFDRWVEKGGLVPLAFGKTPIDDIGHRHIVLGFARVAHELNDIFHRLVGGDAGAGVKTRNVAIYAVSHFRVLDSPLAIRSKNPAYR